MTLQEVARVPGQVNNDSLKGVHFLIPGTTEMSPMWQKEETARVIKARILRWEISLGCLGRGWLEVITGGRQELREERRRPAAGLEGGGTGHKPRDAGSPKKLEKKRKQTFPQRLP